MRFTKAQLEEMVENQKKVLTNQTRFYSERITEIEKELNKLKVENRNLKRKLYANNLIELNSETKKELEYLNSYAKFDGIEEV